jgi:hypothetical protein
MCVAGDGLREFASRARWSAQRSAQVAVMASLLLRSPSAAACRRSVLQVSSRTNNLRLYSSSPPTGIQDPLGYCLQLVQKQDYEGFLAYPSYPKAARPGYLALKAFQVTHIRIPASGRLTPVSFRLNWLLSMTRCPTHSLGT